MEVYPGIGDLQNTKPSEPEKKHPRHIIIKTLNIQNKERILKASTVK
jgi:hypothetical protein